jgi:PEGA domain
VQKKGREMTSLLKRIILGLAMLAIPAGSIAARAESSANARAEAKKHYDRAMELNEDGQVAEAVIELKRCYELSPHHTVLYNLGQAYITLAKPVEAVAALQRYLDEGGKAIKPARRAEVAQEIARQKTRIATLDIRGLPEGALVTIDGDDVGKAPLAAPVRVGVGKHVVAATAAGYEPGEAKIEIAGEDSGVVELKLVPKSGQPAPAAGAVAGLGTFRPASAPEPAPAPTPVPVPASAPVPAPGASLAPAQGEVATSAEGARWSALRIAGIVTASVGVAGLVTGAILWEAAKSKNNDATSQWQTEQSQARSTRSNAEADVVITASDVGAQSQARSTRSNAESLATGANVCLIAGGVLAGVGVITTLFTFVDNSPSKSVALAPALGPSFAGLTMRGTW